MAVTPADLIKEYRRLEAFCDAETKRFSEHLKPHKTKMEELRSQLHAKLIEGKLNNLSTDEGSCYLSTILTPKITDRDVYLKWCSDHWQEGGNEMLIVSKPQITALNEWLDAHDDKPPPGIEISRFQRLNIKA